jgi:hypothetical protein
MLVSIPLEIGMPAVVEKGALIYDDPLKAEAELLSLKSGLILRPHI